MRAALLCAVAALTCAGFASAAGEGPGTVKVGWPPFGADASFVPKSVSRTEFEPVEMNLRGEIDSVDGSHPPALAELILEADKNLALDASGIPICSGGGRQSRRGIEGVEQDCGEAIIGRGGITVEVAFPENTPVAVSSKLLLLNGGVSGRTTTWYLYAFFNAPITGDLVIPVEIRKHRDGRYGTRVVATVPKIAGGYGSVVSFWLEIARSVEGGDGKTHHPVTGRCADGKLQLQTEARFADGEQQPVKIVRSCIPKR